MDETAEGPFFRANKRRKVFRKRAGSDADNDEPFRANKRRKVFRKRAGSDADNDEPNIATSSRPDQSPSADEKTGVIPGEEDTTSRPDIARVRKPKKHGIAFSSSDRTSSRPHNDNEETALVVSEPQTVEQQNGRFTKQTGKTIVEDDKHMSAYVDSKLAELRYGSSTSTTASSQQPSHTPTGQHLAQISPTRDSAPLSPPNPPPPSSTHQQPNPSKQPPPQPSRRKHRGPRQPSPSTTARATLIDQILRESNHTPHYTPSTSTSNTKNSATNNNVTLDPDAAAAEAFKADFLAQAEARNLSRRQPAANASAGAAGATSSGPKLGGSRAARERMRAVEEAKAKK